MLNVIISSGIWVTQTQIYYVMWQTFLNTSSAHLVEFVLY